MNLLILTTDAGGGHRSVARALAAGFEEAGGGSCNVQIVDYLADYAPFPLSRARELYTFLMRYPFLYDVIYEATNKQRGRHLDEPALGLAMEAGMRRLLRDHSPDVIVATHPLGAPALTSLLYRRRQSLPYHTVVTDYGPQHALWAYPLGEFWFVPCQETADHLIGRGVPESRVIVSGYPVHPRFARPERPPAQTRRALGLDRDRFTVLLMGGAEGVGPLAEIVQALAAAPAPWQLVVITGHNDELREQLQEGEAGWAVPVRVEGFVRDIPSRMHAADLLLTKAGGSTLSEGLTSGLPMLLVSVLPGQEEENARHFERLGVARTVPDPVQVRGAVEELSAPASPARQGMLSAIREAARPYASLDIARQVLSCGTVASAAPVPPFLGLHLLQPRASRR